MRRLNEIAVVLLVIGTVIGVGGGVVEGSAAFEIGGAIFLAGLLLGLREIFWKPPPLDTFLEDGPPNLNEEQPPIDVPQSEQILRAKDRGTIPDPWLKT